MSEDLSIKWLFGDSDNRPAGNQSYLMLEVSIRYARLLFPSSPRYIAIPYLSTGTQRIEHLASEYGCKLIWVREHPDIERLTARMKITHARSAWWKYIPLHIGSRLTLHLDNDFIIWRIPEQMQAWLNEGGVLGYGTEVDNPAPHYNPKTGRLDWSKGIHFGSKVNWVREHAGELALNSGLVGVQTRMPDMPVSLSEVTHWKKFVEDQAWWTVNFAKLEGVSKHVIHYERDMPNLSKWHDFAKANVQPRDYMSDYSGAHYTTHNAGYTHYFEKHCYSDFIADLERRENE